MPAPIPEKTDAPPLWPFLLLCAGLAAWIDLGNLHRFENSDSLIPILVSLYRWTPFFWEQNRYGMLVPGLTCWIQHPLMNLLVQDGITAFACLATVFLLARYLLPNRSYPLVAAWGIGTMLLLVPPWQCFLLLVNTCYGVALALGLGGLLLAEARPGATRQLIAVLLLLSAHWVYSAVALLLGPLVALRFWLILPRSDAGAFRRQLLMVITACLAGILMTRLAPSAHTVIQTLPVAEWPEGWRQLLLHLAIAFAPGSWLLGLLLAAGAGILLARSRGCHTSFKYSLRAAFILAVAGIPSALFMGIQVHVQQNDFDARYLLPSVLVWQGALAAAAVTPLVGILRPHVVRRLYLLAGPSLFLTAIFSYGFPSLTSVRIDLDRTLGERTEEVLAGRCTHIVGSYWKVWATVYHANLALYERGEQHRLWGISERCKPTRLFWKQVAPQDLRIAVPVEKDPAADYFLVRYGFPPLEVAERKSRVVILTARPCGTAAVAASDQVLN
jgi:hypothetical protein